MKKKIGRPKGSKNKNRKEEQGMEEVLTDIQSEVGSVTINFKGWVLNGKGNLQELHELLFQLEGTL